MKRRNIIWLTLTLMRRTLRLDGSINELTVVEIDRYYRRIPFICFWVYFKINFDQLHKNMHYEKKTVFFNDSHYLSKTCGDRGMFCWSLLTATPCCNSEFLVSFRFDLILTTNPFRLGKIMSK